MRKYEITECPEFEQLEALVAGKLPADEAEKISMHLQQCGDCRELYESIKELGTDYIDDVTEKINAKIDKRAAVINGTKKSVVFTLSKYAVAAAIVGVGIFGVYKLSDKTQPTVTDSAVAVSEQEDNQEVAVIEEQNVVAEESVQVKSNDKKPDISWEDEVSYAKRSGNNRHEAQVVSDNTVTLRGTDSKEVTEQLTRSTKVKNVDVEKINSKLASATKFMSEGEFFDAKDELEDILNQDPENQIALKKLGICNMNLKYYNQAINVFKRIKVSDTIEKREIDGYIKTCTENLNKGK